MRQRCGCFGMPEVVTELVAEPQVLPGGREVTPLGGDHGQPDVHVGRPAQGRTGLAPGQVEGVAKGALGISEPAQGQLEVGQRDGTAEEVGDVALEPRTAACSRRTPPPRSSRSPRRHEASPISAVAAPWPRLSSGPSTAIASRP